MEGGAADKHWWGPRIWRILHSLAEVSDRAGCGPAWRGVLRATVEVLPCEICRRHFAAAAAGIALPVLGDCRERIRHGLWVAHGGGGVFTEEQLAAEYGCDGNRDAVLNRVMGLVDEVGTAFRAEAVLGRFRAGALPDWERAVRGLVVLLRAPPVAAGTGPRVGGGGRRRR
jgi:hypothetical protein